jgi:hypothetical protein
VHARVDDYLTAVRLGDGTNDRETEAGTIWPGRKKRLEQPVLYVCRNTAPVVGDGQADSVVDEFSPKLDTGGLVACLKSVFDKVEQSASDRVVVACHDQVIAHQRDIQLTLTDAVLEDFDDASEHLTYREFLFDSTRTACITQHIVNQACNFVEAIANMIGRYFLRFRPTPELLRIQQSRSERRSNLVRERCGHFADRRQPLPALLRQSLEHPVRALAWAVNGVRACTETAHAEFRQSIATRYQGCSPKPLCCPWQCQSKIYANEIFTY